MPHAQLPDPDTLPLDTIVLRAGTIVFLVRSTTETATCPECACLVFLPEYPVGKCSCPFFQTEHICKHLYFAVEQSRRCYNAPVEEADNGWVAYIPQCTPV